MYGRFILRLVLLLFLLINCIAYMYITTEKITEQSFTSESGV